MPRFIIVVVVIPETSGLSLQGAEITTTAELRIEPIVLRFTGSSPSVIALRTKSWCRVKTLGVTACVWFTASPIGVTRLPELGITILEILAPVILK